MVLLKCLMIPFLSAVIPRIFMIVFRFAQPLLISRAIRFVTASSVEDDNSQTGAWIVVAAAIVYSGMAVSYISPRWYGNVQAR